jgi:hypothetical protein
MMKKNKDLDKKKSFTYSFYILAVYFLYFSIFDSMKKCGNIYFAMEYIFLVHEYIKMSNTYTNFGIFFWPI